ncbi:hypothetical protein Tco_0488143 [Tanacetum coccineum]
MEITSLTLLRNKCPLGKGYGDGSNHQGGDGGGSIALGPKVVMKVCGWLLDGDKVVTSRWIMVEGGWLLSFGSKLGKLWVVIHDEHGIEEGNELRQMKRKEDNKNDEQPKKRVILQFYNEGQVVENMDGYRDQDMGNIILGEPFCEASCVEERRFDGLITIHNGNDNELICKVLRLLVPLLELNQFGILLGESEEGRVDLQEKLPEIL